MVTTTVTMKPFTAAFTAAFDAKAHATAVDARQRQAYETAGNLAALLDALRHLQRVHPHWALDAATCNSSASRSDGTVRRNADVTPSGSPSMCKI